MLLESWLDFEKEHGDSESIEAIQKRMPHRVKKQRKVYREDGSDAGWEEYWDYVFPDDTTSAPNLKLLEMARIWKRSKAVDSDSGSDSEVDYGEENSDNDQIQEQPQDDRDTDYSESD